MFSSKLPNSAAELSFFWKFARKKLCKNNRSFPFKQPKYKSNQQSPRDKVRFLYFPPPTIPFTPRSMSPEGWWIFGRDFLFLFPPKFQFTIFLCSHKQHRDDNLTTFAGSDFFVLSLCIQRFELTSVPKCTAAPSSRSGGNFLSLFAPPQPPGMGAWPGNAKSTHATLLGREGGEGLGGSKNNTLQSAGFECKEQLCVGCGFDLNRGFPF